MQTNTCFLRFSHTVHFVQNTSGVAARAVRCLCGEVHRQVFKKLKVKCESSS